MNKGFKVYFRKGKQESKKVFKQKGNFLKYYIYKIMSILSNLIPFARPVFALSDVRMARIAEQSGKVEIVESFETLNKPQSYWTSLLSMLVQVLIILSGVLIIGALYAVVISIFSLIIDEAQAYNAQSTIMLIVTIPFAVALLLYVILSCLYFAPKNYYIDSVDDNNLTKTLTKSYCTMKQKVKGTVFMLKFIPFIVIAVLALLFALVPTFNMGTIPTLLILLLILVVFIIVLPRLLLTRDIALIELFKDVMIDKANVVKTLGNINVKSFTKVDPGVEAIKDNLVKLFEDTEDVEYTPEPEFNEVVDDEKIVNDIPKQNEENLEEENKVEQEEHEEPTNDSTNDSINDSSDLTEEELEELLKDSKDVEVSEENSDEVTTEDTIANELEDSQSEENNGSSETEDNTEEETVDSLEKELEDLLKESDDGVVLEESSNEENIEDTPVEDDSSNDEDIKFVNNDIEDENMEDKTLEELEEELKNLQDGNE